MTPTARRLKRSAHQRDTTVYDASRISIAWRATAFFRRRVAGAKSSCPDSATSFEESGRDSSQQAVAPLRRCVAGATSACPGSATSLEEPGREDFALATHDATSARRRHARPEMRHMTLCLIAIGFGPGSALAQMPTVLVAKAAVQPGPYYVGEAVEVRVSVIAGGARPVLTPPKVADADLTPTETKLNPLFSSGIGRAVNETIQYLYRYRLVPRRSGSLTIPPFAARQDGRAGATLPLMLVVREPPIAGQPATFLGGVGPVSVEAIAEPARVRVGEPLELRIRVKGPGARGSTRRFDLDAVVKRMEAPIKVASLSDDWLDDPPSRTYRFRLRPTQPGQFTLPPVAVSTFDPRSERYLTQSSKSSSITAVAVPIFDPASLEQDRVPTTTRALARNATIVGCVVVPLLAIGSFLMIRRLGRSRSPSLSRVAIRLAHGLESRVDGAETARRINSAFVSFLGAAVGRPRGVLTPIEAERVFSDWSGDSELARRASQIVVDCDRVLFSADDERRDDLSSRASALLRLAAARSVEIQKHRERPA
jgi:BatD DUF11 like domain